MTEPVTGSKPSARFYQPELDALRFLAFLAVFLHHKSNPELLLPHLPHKHWLETLVWGLHIAGAYGVHLFFLLSSYLITRLLRREVASTGHLDLRSFYIRRILRIWPLYFFFLALCAVLAWVGFAETTPLSFYLSALFFVGNWYLVLGNPVWFPMVLLWTLSVEEQFYICWPILLRKAKRAHILNVAVATIVLSQGSLMLIRWLGQTADRQVSFNTFNQVQFFGLGALLALWAEDRALQMTFPRRLLLAIAGAALVTFGALFDPRTHALTLGLVTYNVAYLFSALGCIALFRAFLGLPANFFPGWVLFFGRISFGLYIFNIFSAETAKRLCRGHASLAVEMLLTVALNFGLATASWFLLEKPFLRLKSRFEVVKSRPVSA